MQKTHVEKEISEHKIWIWILNFFLQNSEMFFKNSNVKIYPEKGASRSIFLSAPTLKNERSFSAFSKRIFIILLKNRML